MSDRVLLLLEPSSYIGLPMLALDGFLTNPSASVFYAIDLLYFTLDRGVPFGLGLLLWELGPTWLGPTKSRP